MKDKDMTGRENWIGQNVHVLPDGDEITGIRCVAREITERRKMEEALRESEDLFRTLQKRSVPWMGHEDRQKTALRRNPYLLLPLRPTPW